MSTALALLNNVLRGLRRDVVTATSTTNSYHLLLLQFLNSAKEELEDSWDWHALRQTVTLTISSGTSDYALTEAGPADVDVTPRSRLLYEKPQQPGAVYGETETSTFTYGSLPQVFDTTDSTEYRLTELSPEQMERLHFTDSDETAQPTHFAIYRDSTSLRVKVWPTPSGTRTWKMRFVIPQSEIPSTAMTSYTLKIDPRSVWTKALTTAYEERGEEAGRPLTTVDREAQDALFYALDREKLNSDMTGYPI